MLRKIFDFKKNLKYTCFICTVCAIASMLIQFTFDKTPCLLCEFTRICFVIVAITCFFTFKRKNLNRIQLLPLLTLSILFFITFYHLGVENNWWLAPESCRAVLPTLSDPKPIELINDRPPCDIMGFQIFGISMTLFSFAISGILTWLHTIAFVLKKFL